VRLHVRFQGCCFLLLVDSGGGQGGRRCGAGRENGYRIRRGCGQSQWLALDAFGAVARLIEAMADALNVLFDHIYVSQSQEKSTGFLGALRRARNGSDQNLPSRNSASRPMISASSRTTHPFAV
jgi:hypothetical protein